MPAVKFEDPVVPYLTRNWLRSEKKQNCANESGLNTRDLVSAPTLAFSCGSRSAFNREVRNYLRGMLSRGQLQDFVMWRLAETAPLPAFHCFAIAHTLRHLIR